MQLSGMWLTRALVLALDSAVFLLLTYARTLTPGHPSSHTLKSALRRGEASSPSRAEAAYWFPALATRFIRWCTYSYTSAMRLLSNPGTSEATGPVFATFTTENSLTRVLRDNPEQPRDCVPGIP